MEQTQTRGLTQNQLKMIAAVSMLLDHIGAELLPEVWVLRILGRLAFPIFSFSIYEGFRYTHSKSRYLSRMLVLGLLCAAVYYLYDGIWYGNILITFSVSIVALSGVSFFRKRLDGNRADKVVGTAVVLVCLAGVYLLSVWLDVDYGFWGAMLPALAAVGGYCGETETERRRMALIGFAVGLLLVSVQLGGVQPFSLFALPLLAVYNGRRGEKNLKAFFYWFYPVHLAVIGIVSSLLG